VIQALVPRNDCHKWAQAIDLKITAKRLLILKLDNFMISKPFLRRQSLRLQLLKSTTPRKMINHVEVVAAPVEVHVAPFVTKESAESSAKYSNPVVKTELHQLQDRQELVIGLVGCKK